MGTLSGDRIGFIGIGLMGRPMAGHLIGAGAALTVFNRGADKMAPLAARGAVAAQGPGEVADRTGAGIIIACVTDTPALEAVIDAVLERMTPGCLVIDMGTTAVRATREIAGRVAAAGGCYVDAPVSGGEAGAKAASLSIMAGGAPQDVARAGPVFDVLGDKLTHIGDVGAGQVAKAVNQIIVGITLDAVAEGLLLADAAGVDRRAVRAALLGGFAQSRILDVHGQRMIDGDFAPGGRAEVQLKDLRQALDLAADHDLRLPGLERITALWAEMCARGMGDLDQSGFYRLIERQSREK